MTNKMNLEPLVSIITVIYNGEKYLEQTIQSVINQTYKNIEYIIIDGGSTDGTLDIINKYQDYISYFISEPDNGLYDAMNKGIKVANGELIGMINSDDWYELNTVEIVINVFNENPTKSIFHGNCNHINLSGTTKIKKPNLSDFKLKYYGTTMEHPTFFVTKDEYRQHVYNPNLKSLSDYQFMLEALLIDKTKYFYIDQALTNFRLGGVSAQLPIKDKLKEGFIARRNGGMSYIENVFSVFLRLSVFVLYKMKKS